MSDATTQGVLFRETVDTDAEADADAAWERALRHTTLTHHGRPDVIESDAVNPPADRLAELLVSWTANFLWVIEHEHEWGEGRFSPGLNGGGGGGS